MTILILFLKYFKFDLVVKEINYCPDSTENLQICPQCCIRFGDWLILKPNIVLI